MDNLEKSELVIAKILETQMQKGIQYGLVDFSAVIADESLEPFVAECFFWLESEGIVRARDTLETDGNFAAISPVLTSYGFSVLGKKMEFSDDVDNVAAAVANVSTGHSAYAKAGNFSGGLLAAFIKSMS